MKWRHSFTLDAELMGRAKGLVAGSQGRLSLAGLVAMGLAHMVRRLERSGALTTYPAATDSLTCRTGLTLRPLRLLTC